MFNMFWLCARTTYIFIFGSNLAKLDLLTSKKWWLPKKWWYGIYVKIGGTRFLGEIK